jgi:1,4-dihydroxy-2-naphthoate octaprenyltransferase
MGVDVKMWARALTEMPKIDEARWRQLDVISKWLIATRAAVLVMTLSACVISGLLAYQAGAWNLERFILLTLGLLSAHAMNNLLNDRSDHLRGVDRDDAFRTRYGTQPVEQGLMTPNQSLRWAVLCGVFGLGCGLWLSAQVGAQLLPLVASGLILVFAYNWPLKHYGLGEPTVTLVWGPLMVGGGYLSITGQWSWDAALISLPYALGATLVLLGKHTDKIPWDTPRGVRTLPVLLGERAARMSVLITIFTQHALVAYFIYAEIFGWSAVCLLGATVFLRQLVPVYLHPTPAERPDDFPEDAWPLWFSAYAFVYCRRFGVLYILTLTLEVFAS